MTGPVTTPPTERERDTVAGLFLIGIFFAFLLPIVGLVIGLVLLLRHRQVGRGLGVTGLAVSVMAVVTLVLWQPWKANDVDVPAMEAYIEHGLNEQFPDARTVNVDCPDDVEWKTGSSFHCVAYVNHQSVLITVSMETDTEYIWRISSG